ncbi:hypothetical protein ACG74X_20505 [Marivita sp. S0852]|uniref:hypothetical protein n=1 Tax=Marivita sp. S0852 TaxID=3373893 RepID=UPI0039825205
MADECPKCGGQGWKSAKLVVLEGTTKTEGTLQGEIVEKGTFHGGGVRDFLLSDRWFSYESPLSAEFSSTTTSVLVDEIKALMVTEGAKRPMPPTPSQPSDLNMPKEPTKLSRDRGNFFAINPEKVKKPVAPNPPDNPTEDIEEFESRSWGQNFENWALRAFILNAIIFSIAIYLFPGIMSPAIEYIALLFGIVPSTHSFSDDINLSFYLHIPILSDWLQQLQLSDSVTKGVASIIFLILFLISRSIGKLPFVSGIEKSRRKKYDAKLRSLEETYAKSLEKHEIEMRAYRDKLSQWNADIAQFQAEKSAYSQQLTAYENEMKLKNADFQRRMEDYEAEVAEVRSFRSELWDRARMCTRCGTVYLGTRQQN